MRTEGKDVLDAIRKEKAISDDLRAQLRAKIDAFVKTFG
jgi:F-type H+-transporting ATPase subunit alpha